MSRVERNAALEREFNRKKRNSAFVRAAGTFFSVLGIVVITIAIILCLALAAPRFARADSFVVVSGSMEPAIPVGSMVYSRPIEPVDLDVGDVIVFYKTDGEDRPITHRVVENDAAARKLVTKGDANAHEDQDPVLYDNVIGKVVLHIPLFGMIAAPFSYTKGKISMVIIMAVGYLLVSLGGRIRRRA